MQYPSVFVVDDDLSVRESLRNLLRSIGLSVSTFANAQEFLGSPRVDAPSCLVLDMRLPGASGLDLQRQMGEAKIRMPTIFISAHADVPISVRAMKAGATEFLTKPFRDQELIDAVNEAIECDRRARDQQQERDLLQKQYEGLTSREREVFTLVSQGFANKQIGEMMEITEPTVKMHRGRLMHKMAAGSLADLVKMAQRLGLQTLHGGRQHLT